MQKKCSKKCNMNCNKKLLSFILCMMLVAAMAFAVTGCGGSAARKNDSAVEGSF